jgi:hypothetical protein
MIALFFNPSILIYHNCFNNFLIILYRHYDNYVAIDNALIREKSILLTLCQKKIYTMMCLSIKNKEIVVSVTASVLMLNGNICIYIYISRYP